MKTNLIKLLCVSIFISGTVVHAATSEAFPKAQKFDADGVELYDSNLEMKNFKKIGFGLTAGGFNGGLAAQVEVNVQPEDAVSFGIGRGEAYNSFQLSWKHNYEANYMSMYTRAGYAKWFNTSSNSGSPDSNYVLNQVLTSDEIANKKFGADFLAAGAGLEYNQLEGDLSGVNFFGELSILAEIKKSVFVPTAGIGLIYYY